MATGMGGAATATGMGGAKTVTGSGSIFQIIGAGLGNFRTSGLFYFHAQRNPLS